MVKTADNILINGIKFNNSMSGTLDGIIAAVLNNSKIGKNLNENLEVLLCDLPTLEAYIDSSVVQKGIIINQYGEIVTPENAFGTVNSSKVKKIRHLEAKTKENTKKLSLN